MKHTLNYTMRKRKKIKTGRKGKNLVLAAAWVDKELRDDKNSDHAIAENGTRPRGIIANQN